MCVCVCVCVHIYFYPQSHFRTVAIYEGDGRQDNEPIIKRKEP